MDEDSFNAAEPQAIMSWAANVAPEGLETSRAKLESDRFVSSYLATMVRIAQKVIDAVNEEPLDAVDDLQ